MDDLIQERVAQKENELNAEYDERMRNYEERYGLHVKCTADKTERRIYNVKYKPQRISFEICTIQTKAVRPSYWMRVNDKVSARIQVQLLLHFPLT